MRLIALRAACDQCATVKIGNDLFVKLHEHLLKRQKFEAIKFAKWYASKKPQWQVEMIDAKVIDHSTKYLRYVEKNK